MVPKVPNPSLPQLILPQLRLCLPRLLNRFKVLPPCLLCKSQTRQNHRQPRSEAKTTRGLHCGLNRGLQ